MTHTDPDELARTAAIDFARRLVPHWQEALGTELLGAYLIGSLAHAGFSRRYSDIDIVACHRSGTVPTGAGSRAKRGRRAVCRLGTQGLSILDRPAFFYRPISAAGSHRLSRSRGRADGARVRAGPRDRRWKKFSTICAARHLRTGRTVRGASRWLKRSSQRITKRFCGHSSILDAFATAG